MPSPCLLYTSQAQRQHHRAQRVGLVAFDAERLEQVGQAQLQAGDARMGRGQLRGVGQRPRGFYGDQEFPGEAGVGGVVDRGAQRAGALDLGQVQHVDGQAAQRGQVGGIVGGIGGVDADDNFLGMLRVCLLYTSRCV